MWLELWCKVKGYAMFTHSYLLAKIVYTSSKSLNFLLALFSFCLAQFFPSCCWYKSTMIFSWHSRTFPCNTCCRVTFILSLSKRKSPLHISWTWIQAFWSFLGGYHRWSHNAFYMTNLCDANIAVCFVLYCVIILDTETYLERSLRFSNHSNLCQICVDIITFSSSLWAIIISTFVPSCV